MKLCYLSWNTTQDLLHIVTLLKKNEVIVGASDTILGLLANVSLSAYKKLNDMKERADKPYIVLVPDLDTLKQLIKLPMRKDVDEMIKKFWPGPLTIIFHAADTVPAHLAPGGKIGIRIPGHQGLLRILRETGPLFSTSANITGKPVPKKVQEIDQMILAKVAAVVQADQEQAVPSTILDTTGEQLVIIREGVISKNELKEFFLKDTKRC